MLVMIITSANPLAWWGSKAQGNWRTPGKINYVLQGTLSHYAFVMETESFADWILEVNSRYPQFVQTIKCVAFVSEKASDKRV